MQPVYLSHARHTCGTSNIATTCITLYIVAYTVPSDTKMSDISWTSCWQKDDSKV